MENNSREVAEILKILANENRLIILCLLIDNKHTVNEIVELVGNISQSAVSQHLAILRANKIIDFEKKGQYQLYYIRDTKIVNVIKAIKDNYCKD